jgi:hypothetical protein
MTFMVIGPVASPEVELIRNAAIGDRNVKYVPSTLMELAEKIVPDDPTALEVAKLAQTASEEPPTSCGSSSVYWRVNVPLELPVVDGYIAAVAGLPARQDKNATVEVWAAEDAAVEMVMV